MREKNSVGSKVLSYKMRRDFHFHLNEVPQRIEEKEKTFEKEAITHKTDWNMKEGHHSLPKRPKMRLIWLP